MQNQRDLYSDKHRSYLGTLARPRTVRWRTRPSLGTYTRPHRAPSATSTSTAHSRQPPGGATAQWQEQQGGSTPQTPSSEAWGLTAKTLRSLVSRRISTSPTQSRKLSRSSTEYQSPRKTAAILNSATVCRMGALRSPCAWGAQTQPKT